MRQVRTCDFCGDDAAGLYEPYPPAVPDGPRLALCDGCRARLSSVVEPLVAALEGGAEPDSGARSTLESSDEVSGARVRDAHQGSTEPDRAPAADAEADTDRASNADDRSPDPGGADTDDVGESRDAGGRSKGERDGAPPGYRKVMRFLENRELPIEREEAEQLAAAAYELEEDTVIAAIDHAVQYGRLREVGGELKR